MAQKLERKKTREAILVLRLSHNLGIHITTFFSEEKNKVFFFHLPSCACLHTYEDERHESDTFHGERKMCDHKHDRTCMYTYLFTYFLLVHFLPNKKKLLQPNHPFLSLFMFPWVSCKKGENIYHKRIVRSHVCLPAWDWFIVWAPTFLYLLQAC